MNIMKQEKRILVFLVFMLSIGSQLIAMSRVDTTSNFAVIDSTIVELSQQYDVSEILVVLDIDNTILTSSTDLGGDIWYQWQRGKLNLKPYDDQKVDCLFEDAIGLLYELGTMQLTDSLIPYVIS